MKKMLESRRKTFAEKVHVSPLKKVTFYGPVTSRKGEQLRHVGNETVSSRKTLYSTAQSSRGKHDIDFNSKEHLRPKGSEERPHSKTSVLGKQMKTRLHCNHTKPMCEACIANKKKTAKQKHRSLIADIPRQSHVLPSTRSHPRGGTDGRKLYDQGDENTSLSILDATWKPGLDANAEQQKGIDNNSSCSDGSDFKSRYSLDEGTRKKVQFADGIVSKNEDKSINHSEKYSASDSVSKNSNNWQGRQRIGNNSSNAEGKLGVKKSVEHITHERKNYTLNRDDEYDSTTSDQNTRKSGDDDTCRICESLKRRCSKHSKVNPISVSKRDWYPPERHRSHSLPLSSSSSETDEHCRLCQRYGKKHYFIDDLDSCGLCEAQYRSQHKLPSCLHHKTPEASARRQLLRPPIQRQLSTPLFFSDGEDDYLLKRKIPYEPKTEIVKDLKKKLEDEYLHKEYLRKKKNFHRRWRSWDAEDLEDLRDFRRHRCENLHEYIPQHKCVHRYLQNNRLFLEPALTDEDGSSLCSECGAPKPSDHIRDPYLYHITLGGLHNQDKYSKENLNMMYRNGLPKNRSQRTSYLPRDSTKRETSKHAFAKLNRNVNNIFPLNSHYHVRPHLADALRYRVNPHSKRHPSRSMALIDHLL